MLITLLLLVLLLVFQALTKPPVVKKRRPQMAKESTASLRAKVPLDETLNEVPEEEALSASEEPKAIVEMAHNSGWDTPDGSYEVFGEVKSVGQLTARDVSVTVYFKNVDFETLAIIKKKVDHPTLPPGAKSSFKVVLRDKAISTMVGSYVVIINVRR